MGRSYILSHPAQAAALGRKKGTGLPVSFEPRLKRHWFSLVIEIGTEEKNIVCGHVGEQLGGKTLMSLQVRP